MWLTYTWYMINIWFHIISENNYSTCIHIQHLNCERIINQIMKARIWCLSQCKLYINAINFCNTFYSIITKFANTTEHYIHTKDKYFNIVHFKLVKHNPKVYNHPQCKWINVISTSPYFSLIVLYTFLSKYSNIQEVIFFPRDP